MMRFDYTARPVRVRFGRGIAAVAIGEELPALGLERVLLITSRRELPRARQLVAAVDGRIIGEFLDIRQHVPVETADAAVAMATSSGAEGVLAIGGGSAIGTAKVIAHQTGLPIVAVPTTYSGSEMTATWGMTQDGVKTTAVDDLVAPRAVVYDPDLVDGLPDSIAVPSAFNAMAHCIEALWVSRSNPIIDLVALEGIRALAEGLELLDGAERGDATERLLYGAFLGGTALGSVGSGLHHKICHALGGAFDLPHAETHTVILPEVLAFNAPAVPAIAVRIATALGGEDAAAALRALVKRTGAPAHLTDIGLDRDRLSEAVEAVMRRLPVDNPQPVDAAAVEVILRAAL
jgi:alcohol dehydrogenase class IV